MPTFITDHRPGPIGIFDSGYGGLTILEKIREVLPQYDYIYLGDNARAPYGTRSFEVVYEFTRQAVLKLFSMGCRLVILACNTASAKALRSIQQLDLPMVAPDRRVLGIIRPTAEAVGAITQTSQIGVLATVGTIQSRVLIRSKSGSFIRIYKSSEKLVPCGFRWSRIGSTTLQEPIISSKKM